MSRDPRPHPGAVARTLTLAGAIAIPFRTFVAIDVTGRIVRFTTIVMVARRV